MATEAVAVVKEPLIFRAQGGQVATGGRWPGRGPSEQGWSVIGSRGGWVEGRMASWVLVQDSLVCRAATAPVRVPTWLTCEITIDFRDGEGVAMDTSESFSYWSVSSTGWGEILACSRLVGEVAQAFLVKENKCAEEFGGVGRSWGPMGVGSQEGQWVSLSSVLHLTSEQ